MMYSWCYRMFDDQQLLARARERIPSYISISNVIRFSVKATHRSDDPVSKSITTGCPPIITGERYSESPFSGFAAVDPVP
jgi:hypothetical protein